MQFVDGLDRDDGAGGANGVAQAQEIASKQGSQFVRVKDISPFVRRMAPLYSKFMADPTTREELLTIVAN